MKTLLQFTIAIILLTGGHGVFAQKKTKVKKEKPYSYNLKRNTESVSIKHDPEGSNKVILLIPSFQQDLMINGDKGINDYFNSNSDLGVNRLEYNTIELPQVLRIKFKARRTFENDLYEVLVEVELKKKGTYTIRIQ